MKITKQSAIVVSVLDKHVQYSDDLKSKMEYCWPFEFKLKHFKEASSLIKELKQQTPHLLFLDSHLPARHLDQVIALTSSSGCKIVYTYDRLKSKKLPIAHMNKQDLLPKPILIHQLEVIFKQFKGQWNGLNPFALGGRIFLHAQTGIRFVKPMEIILCRALDNYTTFYLVNDEKRIISKPLKSFEKRLGPYNFFRTHQSYLVNLHYVKELIRLDGGKILLGGGLEAYLARSKREDFLEALRSLPVDSN